MKKRYILLSTIAITASPYAAQAQTAPAQAAAPAAADATPAAEIVVTGHAGNGIFYFTSNLRFQLGGSCTIFIYIDAYPGLINIGLFFYAKVCQSINNSNGEKEKEHD